MATRIDLVDQQVTQIFDPVVLFDNHFCCAGVECACNGGIGVGADRTKAFTAAIATTRGFEMRGVTVSAYNRWEDSMHGLAIGIVNITDELHGVQLGLINIVRDTPSGRRILPVINWGG